jgi:hypothetical protein
MNTVAILLFACSFVILLMTLLVKENSALRKYLWKKFIKKEFVQKRNLCHKLMARHALHARHSGSVMIMMLDVNWLSSACNEAGVVHSIVTSSI